MPPDTLMNRARALAGTALVVMPLAAAPAAQAAELLPGYSFAGEYTSSGWFMSWFDDAAADATADAAGLSLTGDKTVADSLFWRFDNNAQATLRRYDVSGFAFAWGGAIDGLLSEGDVINAAFELLVDFTYTVPLYSSYPYPYMAWDLEIGLSSEVFVADNYQGGPDRNRLYSNSAYGSLYEPGSYTYDDALTLTVDDWTAENATQWYAMVKIYWPDSVTQQGYEDTQGALNGDTLRFATLNRGIDLTLLPGSSTRAGEEKTNSDMFVLPSSSTLRTRGTYRNLVAATFENHGYVNIYEGGQFFNSGLLRNLGGAYFTNYGSFENTAGATFDNESSFENAFGGVFDNAGTVNNTAQGSLNNSGTLRNLLGGVLGGAGSISNQSGGLFENSGLVSLLGGASLWNSGTLENRSGATLNIAAGASVENSGTLRNLLGGALGGAGSLTNQSSGVIENSGLLSVLGGASLSNEGSFENKAGGTTDNFGSMLNAFGGVAANRGTLNNASGASLTNHGLLSVLGGASLNNRGNFDNEEGATTENFGTLLNALGGVATNRGTLNNNGQFNNIGTLNNAFGGVVNNRGSFTNSSANTVNNDGLFVVEEGTLTNTATGVYNNTGTLQVAAAGTVVNDGALNNSGSIENAGAFGIGSAGVVSGAGSYAQSAGSTQVDGRLSAATMAFDGGWLRGNGTLASAADIVIGAGAQVSPGGLDEARIGRFAIEGDYVQQADSALLIEVDGVSQGIAYDWLAITGSATLAGDLYLDFGFTPLAGQTFTFLTAAGGVSGQFDAIHAGDWNVAITYGAQSVSLALAAPVPEPETWATLLAGLGLLGWRLRRRA